MGIVRTRKEPGKFFLMHKDTIEDPNLSWKAKGLLAYLMSKPNDWQIWVNDLIKRSSDGEYAVRSGLLELIDQGYAVRKQPRKEDGTFGPIEFIVSERPHGGFPDADNPKADNPDAVYPDADNHQHTNNDCTNNDCSNNDLRKNKSKLQQAKKPKPQSPSPTSQDDWNEEDHENFEVVLESWVSEFGKMSADMVDKMINLWNKYPKLEIHEYAWREMAKANERGVYPNPAYYEKCLETEARRNWVVDTGDNGHGKT